jgi:mono/diheme cytochrome c family protein
MNRILSATAIIALALLPAVLHAAQGIDTDTVRGEQVFQVTCANAYCHGVAGAAGSAPPLAAQGFDAAYIATIIRNGKPNTTMAGFAGSLTETDINAVMAYVAGLNGISNPVFPAMAQAPVNPASSNPPLTGNAALGKTLFFDAYAKGLNRCSTCHQVQAQGIPVAAIAALPDSVEALLTLEATSIRELLHQGQRLPVISAGARGEQELVYDLTTVPPVLLSLDRDALNPAAPPANWQHADYLQSYTDTELLLVLDYLAAVLDNP